MKRRMLFCLFDEIWRPLCLDAFEALHIDRVIQVYKKKYSVDLHRRRELKTVLKFILSHLINALKAVPYSDATMYSFHCLIH
jgi:hypothetical protein